MEDGDMKENNKYYQNYKIILLIFIILFSMIIGGGIRTALADQDLTLMMSNWFNKKKESSIADMEKAITDEKQILLKDLENSLSKEMQKAADQLASFTVLEKQNRINNLNEYAKSLKSQMKIDNSEQEEIIQANLDAIIAQAVAQMDGQANELKLIAIPPGTDETETEAPVSPVEEPEKNIEGHVKPPVQSDKEDGKKKAPEADEVLIGQPVIENETKEVDIYSVTDWFIPPNTQNITVEEIEIPEGVFSINSTFSDILMNQQAADAMRSILRGIEKHPQFTEIQYKTIDEMSRISPSLFNETILYLLNSSLSQIKT